MKPRRAAALALVGWILVLPPVRERGGRDVRAPLGQWGAGWQTFNSEKECNAFLADTTKQRGWWSTYGGMCVTENDPRFAQARATMLRERSGAKPN
jgi:hypothetical protein